MTEPSARMDEPDQVERIHAADQAIRSMSGPTERAKIFAGVFLLHPELSLAKRIQLVEACLKEGE